MATDVSGFPFGSTAMDGDTGFRYQGGEIHVVRDTHKWRIYLTQQQGKMPQRPLLDKPDGVPLAFESRDEALRHAGQMFLTVDSLQLGQPFTVKSKEYVKIRVPNWKGESKHFVPVLDLESFLVLEMHKDTRPSEVRVKDGEGACEPSSSSV